VQRHGISRQVQQPSLGSTPHDRVTLLRICPSRSLALDRPQQNTARYPSVVTNRPTTCRLRHHPSLTHQPLYRRTPRCISSIQISQLARGTQIPIAPAAPLHVTLSAVSFLGGFRTPAAEHAAPSLKRPASETLPLNRHGHPNSADCFRPGNVPESQATDTDLRLVTRWPRPLGANRAIVLTTGVQPGARHSSP
jgi:hypothetical protein